MSGSTCTLWHSLPLPRRIYHLILMLPPRTRLDPEGFYARLGLEPGAPQASVTAAFRAKARLLHPDIPQTGNAEAFVRVRQAYDVLSNRDRRADYDRQARQAVEDAIEPEVIVVNTALYRAPAAVPLRQPRFSDLPIAVWVGVAAVLGLGVFEAVTHLRSVPRPVNAGIRPNAATVEPLSPTAHRAVLYGPTPVRLAGTPNFYVTPAGTPAVLWRFDSERNTLVPLSQLPPFSEVQAVRLIRQSGMLEVLINDRGNGFVSADHLIPGDAIAARAAYCGYNSGPTPFDGELLERRGSGHGTLGLENRSMQPAVVKLRDETGAVAIAVFLGPGGHADLDGLPEGQYWSEFAVGELWSRACNGFVAGMRARRMEAAVSVPSEGHIVVAPDATEPAAADISDQAFEQN